MRIRKFRYFVAIIPLVIGYIGFIQIDGISPSWALYHSMNLYGLNTGVDKINGLIEVARWTAPMVTATALLLFFRSLITSFSSRVRSLRKDSCSVYGNNEDARIFLENLGKQGVKGSLTNPYFTNYHVIFSKSIEELMENAEIDLVDKISNRRSLLKKDARVIVQVNGYTSINLGRERLSVFSMESNASLLYWRRFPAKSHEKIGIIGSGTISDALIDEAMMVNILDTDQRIEYHVWDSDNSYQKTHTQLIPMLELVNDAFVSYADDWRNSLEELQKMDRIIICNEGNDNLNTVLKVLDCTSELPVHVYTRYERQLKVIMKNDRLSVFGTADELLNREVILKESLYEEAKNIHEHYREKYPDMVEWNGLDGFGVKSNLAAASYFPVMRRLHEAGCSVDQLVEFEHIRWCRFHFKDNWKYGEVKDAKKRTHPCLVAFDELSEDERLKDLENVELGLKG